MAMLTIELPEDLSVDEARLLLALKLFETHRVSTGKAAEIAGYSKPTFMELAGKHGVFCFKVLLAYVVANDSDEVCDRYLVTTYRRASGRTPEEALSAMVASIEENNPPYENSDGDNVQIRFVGILDAINASTLDEDEVWCDVRTECCNVNALATGLPNTPTLLDKLR